MIIPAWLYLATLFAAGWFCCRCQTPYDPPPCTICTDDNDTISITIAGLSNATCSGCAFFNATFILPRTSGNACKWQKTGIGGACNTLGQPYVMSVLAGVLSPSSNVGFHAGVQVSSYYGGTMNIEYTNRRWNSGSTADFDCTATRVTSAYTYLQDSGCNGWSTATIEVNP